MKRKISALLFVLLLLCSMSILASAANVKMNKSSATIQIGDSVQLEALVNGVPKKATWGSSDPSVATVNANGLVTGQAAGSSVITAMVDGASVDCVVSVVKRTTLSNARYNVLIIDTSGSMKGTPLKRVKTAAKRFSKTVLKSDGSNYLAIISLNSSPKVVCNFTDNISTLNKAINKLKASGETNMNKAFQKAGELLDAKAGGAGVMKNIILCSDGLPQSGTKLSAGRYTSANHKKYKFANAVYKTDVELKNKDYFVYALGFFHNSKGKDLSFGKQLMKDLASKDKYFIVTKPTDIDHVFNNIAADINNVEINAAEITLKVGQTYQLSTTVNDVISAAKWKSSAKGIASVSASGKVTAKKKGTAVITATVKGQSVTCRVTVKTAPVSIKLDRKNAEVYVGNSITLNASVTGTTEKVKWSTNKKAVATVKNGKVTGIKAGTAVIKATVKGKTVSCKVTVKNPSLTLDQTSMTLIEGESKKLTATVSGPTQTVVWKSSNEKIAAVDSTGNVKAIAVGTAQITASANGISAVCTVYVKEKPYREIYTVEDLKNVANNLSGTYYLMNDLNLNGQEWTPLGNSSTPFKGKFYGNGHRISNIYINATKDDQGLFGYTDSALIERLEVTGKVTGGTYAGGIVGRLTNNSTISYCINYATVTGAHQTGGVVGRVSGGTIEYCLNYGEVSTNGRGCGGISADIYPKGKIVNCVNMVNVSGGSDITGGIVGGCTSGPVENCFNTGNVTGKSRKGAIAGDNASYAGKRANNYFLKTETVNAGFSPIGTGSGTFNNLNDQRLLNAIAAIKAKF